MSADELATINALVDGGLNHQQISQDAATAAGALAQAVQEDGRVVAKNGGTWLKNCAK